MKTNDPSQSSPEHQALRQRLSAVREALLSLHKTLVDSERISYEKTVGQIASSSKFLQLLVDDPWFAWLQPMSQLIVAMDVALDEKEEPLTAKNVDAMIKQTKSLLAVSETGEDTSGHYFAALQRDPDVVLAHAAVIKLVK